LEEIWIPRRRRAVGGFRNDWLGYPAGLKRDLRFATTRLVDEEFDYPYKDKGGHRGIFNLLPVLCSPYTPLLKVAVHEKNSKRPRKESKSPPFLKGGYFGEKT